MSTYMANAATVDQKWFVIDAADQVVGRLAVTIANMLRGKHKPEYTPHCDTGDFIIVVNAEKVAFTGKKWDQKKYAWYTGYTRQRTIGAADRLEKSPELILQEAVRRMLPKNKLGAAMLSKLKIYKGADHPHQAQQPEPTELASIA